MGDSEQHSLERSLVGKVSPKCSHFPSLQAPPRTVCLGQSHLRVRSIKSKDRTARAWTQNTKQIRGWAHGQCCGRGSRARAISGFLPFRVWALSRGGSGSLGSSVLGSASPTPAQAGEGHRHRGRAYGQQGGELTESGWQFH